MEKTDLKDPMKDAFFSREDEKSNQEMMARGYNPDELWERGAYLGRGFTEKLYLENIAGKIPPASLKVEIPEDRPTDRRDRVYYDFLKDPRFNGLLNGDTMQSRGGRVNLLQAYFPRFRNDGRQSLRGYSDIEVERIFRRVSDYAQKRLKG